MKQSKLWKNFKHQPSNKATVHALISEMETFDRSNFKLEQHAQWQDVFDQGNDSIIEILTRDSSNPGPTKPVTRSDRTQLIQTHGTNNMTRRCWNKD